MDINYQIPRSALVWVLASVVMVIIPQTFRMPYWVTVIAVVCIIWRILIFTGKLSYPGRKVRVAAVIFTLLVSATQMRSIGLGLDSAASLLALGFVFKLIEMQHKRDIYVVLSLCFVMSMVSFLYSQGVVTSAYIAIVIVVIVSAMIALNKSPLSIDGRGTARLAMKITLQAVPLTIVLFLLFPRIAPLWAVPTQNSAAGTGVSDEMSPGDISRLVRNGGLAFRVQFEDSVTLPNELLYWRGLVLDDFDGDTWRRTRSTSAYGNAAAFANFRFNWDGRMDTNGMPFRYNVIMEPTQQPWLYGLHLAEPVSDGIFRSRNFEMFNNGLVTQRISYDIQSYINNQTDILLTSSPRRNNIELPDEGNEESLRFARELRASVDSDRDYAMALLNYFATNEYYYTLNPALLGENRVDEFLFNTMEGFCEHYASAFAFLMRAVGIPARVVVGYQGAETNPYEDYMIVYQYNAHAWNEVWLDGEGWVRFDPTGAVSPVRILEGAEAALREDPGFLDESLLATFGSVGFFNMLRLRFDALEYEWNRRVVNYDEEIQFDLFQELFGEVTESKVLIFLITMVGIVIVAVGITIIRVDSSSRRDPVVKLYLSVSKELEKVGLARKRGEGPLDYRDRVIAERPELAEIMNELTALYMQLSYEPEVSSTPQQHSRLKELKAMISQLRYKVSPLAKIGRTA
ncbi:MAG: DUF3488 domain-containing protein [Pseudomonadales bacterium]|nr:DUF3488 domain-containing protein [Pseudomonadales bacterium]